MIFTILCAKVSKPHAEAALGIVINFKLLIEIGLKNECHFQKSDVCLLYHNEA